ncbi:PLP-dependent aminotransferase family protein [Thiospirochaeta perfilievii]|uniref:PLP-dependent aminotransferase family protein n=1 Tax=Thiospirochaeta perfilievii TaxID=252967 RepID=A0A5C1QDB4_9SPIO|nr:PLP-dependent aminotransferase family protein [Thiospirochaeta perfilievii]QEN04626.1 PLP-dependent aminotransferase family protein [Thiospirochaeta perfilievii]
MSFKYEKIFKEIEKAILNGVFLPSEKLPSLRKSATTYDCGISVVIQAYNKLESIGLIESVEKSGYIVRDRSETPIPAPEKVNHTLVPNITKTNLMTAEMVDMAMDKSILPFGAAIPDNSIIASKKLGSYISRKAKNNPDLFTTYTPASGSLNLRKEIVKYMYKKGVLINSEDIVITNGCSEALFISLSLITTPGDTIAIETPTYFSLISILEELNLRVVEIPTRADRGLDINNLSKIIKQNSIKALVFSSTFQNPLCSVMSPRDLESLYRISLDNDFTLIEDDIYGDCGFDKSIYRPLKSMDKFNRVIYCSSFSKTLSSGLRVGWAIPGIHTSSFRERKQISCLGGSALIQEALADFFKDGSYDSHIKLFRKKIYAQTYGIKKLLENSFSIDVKVTSPKGGYFLWVEFPIGFDSCKLYRLAYENRIGIVPGPVFSASDNYNNCIRISCASQITEATIEGLQLLGELALTCLPQCYK